MNHPLISIIVPVYNTERYLQECIDSIKNQTYPHFELILVNDGSPDSCGDICERNAKADSRIKVIHQENQGVTRARANGVAAAVGEFVTFVDSDDTLLPNALFMLIEPINKEIDIVVGKISQAYAPPAGIICKEEYRKLCAMMQTVHLSPCAKIYRRTLFTNELFDLPRELRLGEDAIMNIRLAYRVQGKIFSINKVVYEYRKNENSATHTLSYTLESTELFQRYQLSSIPLNDVEYLLPLGLAKTLIYFWMSSSCNARVIPHTTLPHLRYLHSIKKYANLRMGLYPTLLFYCTNSFIRTLLITMRNFMTLRQKSRVNDGEVSSLSLRRR